MSQTIALPALPETKYKMQLLNDEFMTDVDGNRGRYPAGAILLVQESTAIRWYENNVAIPADPEAPTHAEIRRTVKREEFFKQARAAEGIFDGIVTRRESERPDGRPKDSLMPPPMPVPPRRTRRTGASAEGAELANGTDYVPAEDED